MRLKMKERMLSTIFLQTIKKIYHQWIKGLTCWSSSQKALNYLEINLEINYLEI